MMELLNIKNISNCPSNVIKWIPSHSRQFALVTRITYNDNTAISSAIWFTTYIIIFAAIRVCKSDINDDQPNNGANIVHLQKVFLFVAAIYMGKWWFLLRFGKMGWNMIFFGLTCFVIFHLSASQLSGKSLE